MTTQAPNARAPRAPAQQMPAQQMPAQRTPATAALVYWLLVICGLAGITLLRIDTPRDVLPLWIGSLAGLAGGQFFAWLRVRAWVIFVVSFSALWCSALFLAVLFGVMGGMTETTILAFLPAAVCGYLSLSERGALVAFWYPAVLWMILILDRPNAAAFDARAALPFVVGLAALFVVYLRARETRRSTLWAAHANVRLAKPLPRKVLRTSPLRAASQIAWTGLAGASALVLAAWIAPHLWAKEARSHTAATTFDQGAAQTPSTEDAAGSDAYGGEPCCESAAEESKRERVREYFPLLDDREAEQRKLTKPPCAPCQVAGPRVARSVGPGASRGFSRGSAMKDPSMQPGPWYPDRSTPSPWTPTPSTTPSPETFVPAVAAPTPWPPPPVHEVAPAPAPEKSVAEVAAGAPAAAGARPPPGVTVTKPRDASLVFIARPAAPPPPPPSPWKSVLALCVGGLALHVLVRAARRQLTLRHLARPFWAETLDQRISNHWQRVLIGLVDAGIQPAAGEQPQALAKRVGIEGMKTCATILERVRHGVRVDETDLAAMDASAGAVYRAARVKAGALGRAAAWLRWPLAGSASS